jgi:hypothetical protein
LKSLIKIKLSYESSNIEKELKMKNVLKWFGVIAITAVIVTLAGCASMTLVSIESVEGPRQVRQGEDISPNSITVWAIYKDGSRKVASVSASSINFDKNVVGPQTVRVRLSGQEGRFETEVMALNAISVTSQPRTPIFKQGQAADSAWPGLEVQGEWDQMGTQRIQTASLQFAGFDSSRVGSQTITVTFGGKSASFNVEVKAMTSIRITDPPRQVDYTQGLGQYLDIAGLRVVGVWEGLPEEELTIARSDVSGFNQENGGVQTLTVTKSGQTATFTVDVWALTGIVLNSPPDKTDYALGERLVLTGIEVEASYAGSTPEKRKTETIAEERLTVSGYNPNTVGRNQRITVTFGTFAANFFVNVSVPETVAPAPPPAQ